MLGKLQGQPTNSAAVSPWRKPKVAFSIPWGGHVSKHFSQKGLLHSLVMVPALPEDPLASTPKDTKVDPESLQR